MDVVYLFRAGPRDSLALRFSLRSLKNMSYDKVYIVGDKPEWIENVVHIRYSDTTKRGSLNTFFKLIRACKVPELSQEFILMDDDHLILRPVEEIPYYSSGLISEVKKAKTQFYYDLQRTGALFDNAISFNKVHVPIVYDKDKVLELASVYDLKNKYLHKSLYGNHFKCVPVKIGDAKARSMPLFKRKLATGSFVSLSDNVEKNLSTKVLLKKYFPKRSVYEKTNIF